MLTLRPFQKEALAILNSTHAGQTHLLCVAPTGSGKTLIYERTAMEANQRTLLITPLIALARQQFQTLQQQGVMTTLGVQGSSQGPPKSKSGAWIVSPESLTYSSRQRALKAWRPTFLVVDECHCLWEWGDGFRPAFAILPKLLIRHSIRKSLWLTATLPFEARLELKEKLPSPLLEIGKFELPTRLSLQVKKILLHDRPSFLAAWLKLRTGSGIIFVPTREATYRVARLVSALGRNPVVYHSGISVEEKRNIENLIQQRIPDTIVATSAFGMGMNYLHLSFVVLWQLPMSLLSLVQSIGRVGRNPDSENFALILWEPEDFRLLEWTINNSSKRRNDLLRLYDFLETSQCRKVFLKFYFDRITDQDSRCHQCDNCLTF